MSSLTNELEAASFVLTPPRHPAFPTLTDDRSDHQAGSHLKLKPRASMKRQTYDGREESEAKNAS